MHLTDNPSSLLRDFRFSMSLGLLQNDIRWIILYMCDMCTVHFCTNNAGFVKKNYSENILDSYRKFNNYNSTRRSSTLNLKHRAFIDFYLK